MNRWTGSRRRGEAATLLHHGRQLVHRRPGREHGVAAVTLVATHFDVQGIKVMLLLLCHEGIHVFVVEGGWMLIGGVLRLLLCLSYIRIRKTIMRKVRWALDASGLEQRQLLSLGECRAEQTRTCQTLQETRFNLHVFFGEMGFEGLYRELEHLKDMVAVDSRDQLHLMPWIFRQHADDVLKGSLSALAREVELVVFAHNQERIDLFASHEGWTAVAVATTSRSRHAFDDVGIGWDRGYTAELTAPLGKYDCQKLFLGAFSKRDHPALERALVSGINGASEVHYGGKLNIGI